MRTTTKAAVTLAAIALTACASGTDPVIADVQTVCRNLGFSPGDTGDYATLPDGVLASVSGLTDKASAAAQKDHRWWTLTQDLSFRTVVRPSSGLSAWRVGAGASPVADP
ncbi:hypothetical protein [Streptomyces sp. NPDC005407]|uniref:hypothetical protein n=1 Tax=Streptomyces sp. NPDC005407 TaxID=3155340 RepID=UPI0033A96C30